MIAELKNSCSIGVFCKTLAKSESKTWVTLVRAARPHFFHWYTHNKLPGHARLSLSALHRRTVFSPTRDHIQIHKAVLLIDFARLKSTASYLHQTHYVSTPRQSPLKSSGHSSYFNRLAHLLASSSSSSSCCEITCICSVPYVYFVPYAYGQIFYPIRVQVSCTSTGQQDYFLRRLS